MCIFAIYIYFSKEWESHSEVDLTDLLDGLVGLWFLREELVAGESEYHEVIVRVGIPEGFEFCELWSESALGRSIDDEEDFSLVFAHRDCFSVRLLDADVVDRCIYRREYMSFWIFR
jgi:hypothetical protein